MGNVVTIQQTGKVWKLAWMVGMLLFATGAALLGLQLWASGEIAEATAGIVGAWPFLMIISVIILGVARFGKFLFHA